MIINSGLGWKCSSAYYVDKAGTLGTLGSIVAKKTNDGPAICFVFKENDLYFGFITFSTVNKYAANNLGTVATRTINGETWYLCGKTYNGYTNVNTKYPVFVKNPEESNNDFYIRALTTILAEANKTPQIMVPVIWDIKKRVCNKNIVLTIGEQE